MGTPLTPDDFGRLLRSYARSAFRLEVQRQYLEPTECEAFACWRAGSRPDPRMMDGMTVWLDQIRDLVASGRTVERVRVQEDPPTEYQAWERWVGELNAEAGEVLRYMTREKAHEVGLLPAAGDEDWWLLDDEWLIVMTFDEDGHRLRSELVHDPEVVARARRLRDLAVHHSMLDSQSGE